MNCEIRSISPQGRETPASMERNMFAEMIASIMVMFGIEAISYRRIDSGEASKLHSTIAMFDGVSNEYNNQAIVVKDAIAQIMAAANIQAINTKPSKDELAELRKMWSGMSNAADSVNAGSSVAENGE